MRALRSYSILICLLCCLLSTATARERQRESHPPLTRPQPPTAPTVTPSADDCALRRYMVQYVGFLQPNDFSYVVNWTELAASALEVSRCDASTPLPTTLQPTDSGSEEYVTQAEHFDSLFADNERRPKSEAAACDLELFVDGARGNDTNEGSATAPLRTIQHALDVTRARDRQQSPKACVTVRAGTYYLGGAAASYTTDDSTRGVIQLTAVDSGLLLRGAANEKVVLSGGSSFAPVWKKYKDSVLQATLPTELASIDQWHLNELYVDGKRAVRAKYPNGDPATHGLWNNQGWIPSAPQWMEPRRWPRGLEIRVATPVVSNINYPVYTMGVAVQFEPQESFWETSYTVPSGVMAPADLTARMANWKDATTGVVFAYHSGHWGSWVFDIAAVNSSTGGIEFGRGGFQEARGSGEGAEFYVSGILEELDDNLEWHVDRQSRTLYFQPNQTAPTSVVVSQVPCILSIHGTENAPATGITIQGFTFSHTANTFMRNYSVPSGGDWSIHGGGAVYAEGTESLLLHGNRFLELSGNAVVIRSWNLAASIDANEFAWLGDSGVVLLGQSSGIDGISNHQQPTLTAITRNLFHEGGAYIKQSAPIVQFLSRSTRIIHNVIFNIPRAGININDQFGGDILIAGNAIFNAVRETSDHGPINSWNRLPYLTGSPASLVQATSYITRNLLFNTYNCVWPLDHDDGSSYWDDSYNVLIYGGAKNYLGEAKHAHDTLYIYPEGVRYDPTTNGSRQPDIANRARSSAAGAVGVPSYWGTFCSELDSPAWGEQYYNNICAMQRLGLIYDFSGCDVAGNLSAAIPWTYNNTFLLPAGVDPYFTCNDNGASRTWNLTEWQQTTGYDSGSTVSRLPSVDVLLKIATQMLGTGSKRLFQHASLPEITACVLGTGTDDAKCPPL